MSGIESMSESIEKLCECGCGQLVKCNKKGKLNRFVNGHNMRGNQFVKGKHWKLTEEQRLARCGTGNPMFDKNVKDYMTSEAYEEMNRRKSESTRGIPKSEEHNQKNSEAHLGKTFTEEHCQHIKDSWTPERRNEQSKRLRSLSEGISYDYEFSDTLKEQIRRRDRYRCVLCGKEQIDQILEKYLNNTPVRKLDIHHIDYNKKNSVEENLVTLCHSCHMRTNVPSKRFLYEIELYEMKPDELGI